MSDEQTIGSKYGRLTVIGIDGWFRIVRCDCGTERRVRRLVLAG